MGLSLSLAVRQNKAEVIQAMLSNMQRLEHQLPYILAHYDGTAFRCSCIFGDEEITEISFRLSSFRL